MALAVLALAGAPSARAASYVKSVEYVPITIGTSSTSVSANLTKGQVVANCVPFATASGNSSVNGWGLAFVDVFLTAGSPSTVTAQRTLTGGIVTVGVFVVEFDPTYVKVQQGTYAIASGSASATIVAITAVDLARAALVHYNRNDAPNNGPAGNEVEVEGWFQSNIQVNFQRNTSGTAINGHWYVFEALNVFGSYAFAVQPKIFTFSTTSGSSTALSPAVLSSKTIVVGSYQTTAGSDHLDVTSARLYLSGCSGSPSTCTLMTADKYTGASTTVAAFAVTFAGQVSVQRGSFSYLASDSQKTATLSPAVNLAMSMAWNALANGPGSMSTNEGSGDSMYQGQQRLTLPNATTVQANRDGTGNTSVSTWEVVQWGATTAVTLAGFDARGFDSGVLVEWETASELDNLGFNLYRAPSPDGPWTLLNESLIPGLGSSPEGKSYSWTDAGLVNGTAWYYRLEDVDRQGMVTVHGPVAATPQPGPIAPGGGEGEVGVGPTGPPAPPAVWSRLGDPDNVSLRVVDRSPDGMTVELLTSGFYSRAAADGTTRLRVPGFFDRSEPGRPVVPTRRFWADALVGHGIEVTDVRASDVVAFDGARPALAGRPVAVNAADGTFQARSLPMTGRARGRGLFPEALARVGPTAFEGEAKKAYVELAPLRVDEATGRITLARRLLVRLAFRGRVRGETGSFDRGRRVPAGASVADPVALPLARFATRADGLCAVRFEEIPGLTRPVPVSSLRLSRRDQAVAIHVEPRGGSFGPGSTLYFLADGTASAYTGEAVYELSSGTGGLAMPGRVPGRNGAPSLTVPLVRHTARFEQDAAYLPSLLEARDLWVWDYGLGGGQGQDYSFTLDSPALVPESAHLTVDLQGGSDTPVDPDHHVVAWVNGSRVGETSFDGMVPETLELEVPAALLQDGANTLRLENAGDTGSTASFVYLDRFSVEYTRGVSPVAGVVEGVATATGRISLPAPAGSVVIETTDAVPRWLGPARATRRLEWSAEEGHRYLAVSTEALLHPEVRPIGPTALRDTQNQADWIAIAPSALLPALDPLVAQREAQGLRARAVSLEDVVSAFGGGEISPQAVRDFLVYAFQRWAGPAPRYVLLLGDASYDPRGHLSGTSRPDLVPSPLTKSTYLWTASDPTYAAVNGDDPLPDLAIGRITAATLEEAQDAVRKILDFEDSGRDLGGRAVLVADNADVAGNFEQDQDAVALLLGSRPVQKVYLTHYASAADAKADVLGAFDAGASLVSYVGHGSSGLWASEGLLRSTDLPSLQPQAEQPLVVTLTCSNGYFLSPYTNSLSEKLVLAPDRGAIAAFSPSGLSVDEAAQVLHQALVLELQTGSDERLGDVVLAAQAEYAASGAFPELLAIYHLFGDPALKIR